MELSSTARAKTRVRHGQDTRAVV